MELREGDIVKVSMNGNVISMRITDGNAICEPLEAGVADNLYDRLLIILSDITGINTNDLRNTRKLNCSCYRAMAFWLMRKTGMTMQSIGKMSERDHSTISWALANINNYCAYDKHLQRVRKRFEQEVISQGIIVIEE